MRNAKKVTWDKEKGCIDEGSVYQIPVGFDGVPIPAKNSFLHADGSEEYGPEMAIPFNKLQW